MMLYHMAAFNAVFASVQLLIAAGLFFRRTVKPALALSILWTVQVWWFGEASAAFLRAQPRWQVYRAPCCSTR
jgi:hypothetical protein